MCCISVTLLARLIGLLDLSASIFGIQFLAQEFFSDEQRSIEFNDMKIFMGLSWTKRSTNIEQKLNHTWIFASLLAYSTLYFFCSAGLISATLLRNKHHAVPWLTFEIISLANQGSGIVVSTFQLRCDCDIEICHSENALIAGFYFFVSAYFWFVVFNARNSWAAAEPSDAVFLDSGIETSIVASHKVIINPPKTASPRGRIQSSNFFQSPKITEAPPKYYEI
ncbi:uncharacterized protein LOC124179459 [Neodiprion fabricii]|uniref:uncharacterized protein LOC124179459 n=1 Tax=Neodiprion fabricii TaxID=2872261 RepID=UPI001ED8F460|nr:uncharacterized protein LOC124179459 [Neodiprion fabricii]